jgi:hypothetical protein
MSARVDAGVAVTAHRATERMATAEHVRRPRLGVAERCGQRTAPSGPSPRGEAPGDFLDSGKAATEQSCVGGGGRVSGGAARLDS